MKIVTDCAADMSEKELEELDVVQAPLYIQFPEGEVSSTEISADDFYDRLEAMQPNLPTTAMPSSGLLAEIYSRLSKADREILSLHISSGLSGTINAARGAADQIRQLAHVDFWDTLTLSGGQRFQVIAAALAARAGWTMSAIQERLALDPIPDGGHLHSGHTGLPCSRRTHRTRQGNGRRAAASKTDHPRRQRREI